MFKKRLFSIQRVVSDSYKSTLFPFNIAAPPDFFLFYLTENFHDDSSISRQISYFAVDRVDRRCRAHNPGSNATYARRCFQMENTRNP